MRYQWLVRRLVLGRTAAAGRDQEMFPLTERSEMIVRSMEAASFGWLVDLTRSVMGYFREREEADDDRDCLVDADRVAILKARALAAIRAKAEDGSLLPHDDLLSLLWRWRQFADGDRTEILAWTNSVLANDENVVTLARRSMSESWSAGIGFDGMGDRVATRTVTVAVNDDTDIIDMAAFIAALQRIDAANSIGPEQLQAVRTFLEAWRTRRN